MVHCAHDEIVSISSLKLNPENRNHHPEEQIDRLAKILEYQGWRYPVKVSNRSGFVVSGHGRILAAKKLGWTEAPVNFQDYDSDEQEYADAIADNSIALWADLDLAGINADIVDLGPDFDLDLLGLEDFVLEPAEKASLDDKLEIDPTERHFLEVEFKTLPEMMEVYDELLSRGLIVRTKNG